MATTMLIMTTLKLASAFGTGIAISSAFKFFHSFEPKFEKNKTKEKGEKDVSKISEALREKSRSVN